MTARSDIYPNKNNWRRLSYTRRCGWVDWGHALPGNALLLKRQMDQQGASWPGLSRARITLNGRPAFAINYGQSNRFISLERHWIVRRDLSPAARKSAALGIFLSGSFDMEGLQGAFPFTLITDSSFSAEDLVSNVIGFYSAFEGFTQAEQRRICGETSVRESLHIWDTYLPNGLGSIKNRTLKPILFPLEDEKKMCVMTSFPTEFSTIRPSQSGTDWVRLRSRFLPGMAINGGRPIEADRSGSVQVR